ncbi:MAG: hypothetical protein AAGH15_09500 [Myxococcota bacterium]
MTKWLAKTRPERANARLARYADDPAAFAEEVLGLTVWSKMRVLFELVRDHMRVAVRSGHKCSKSTSAVVVALWWCLVHPGDQTLVILTAPSAHQIENILWEELRRRLRHMKKVNPSLRAAIGPELGKAPHRGFRLFNGARIVGISTNQPERLAGISAAKLLFIIDEASGFEDALWEVVQGNEATGARVLAISNPTRPDGWFADAFRGRGEFATLHISSEETPNIQAGKIVIPGLATPEWLERFRREYGPEPEKYLLDRRYKVRVLGEFPDSTEDSIIKASSIDGAGERWTGEAPAHGHLVLGVDPADFGADDAVIQPVRGLYAYPPRVMTGALESSAIAAEVVKVLRDLRRLPADQKVTVVLDSNGEAGGGCREALKATEAFKRGEFELVLSHGFRKADRGDYADVRTKLWFELDDWLRRGAVHVTPELRKELLAVSYGYRLRDAKLEAEKKRDTKKRLGRSPNLADALTLAVSRSRPIEFANDIYDDDREERGAGSYM